MPQDVAFSIPFPSRRSPDYERAEAGHLTWPRALGLISSEAAAQRHRKGGFADLAARFYPQATGDDLDLGVDLMSWFFLFDDLFDGPRGEDPLETGKLIDAVAAALDVPPPPDSPLIAHGFADWWQRAREGMSAGWCIRTAGHWRSYLHSHVEEAASRQQGRPFDPRQYLDLRRRTIGVQPTLDLAERTGHYEVPARVADSAILTAMVRIVMEINILFNDIASLEKEHARGEQNNMVIILMHEHGWTPLRSIAHITDEVHGRIAQFQQLEGSLPKLYDTLRLDPREREAVERYRTDGLRTMIRGSYDWHRLSGRYDTEYALAAGHQGYLEELGNVR
jgi:pentalenene synthase